MSEYAIDSAAVTEKVAARELAAKVFSLLREEAPSPPGACDEYWKVIRTLLDVAAPVPVGLTAPVTPVVQPLTEDEIRAFKRVWVPFGKYQVRSANVRDVVLDAEGRDWLEWLADQRFVDNVRRLLATPYYRRLRSGDRSADDELEDADDDENT